MKAQELRIGNWFRQIDDDGDRPVQVKAEDLLAWSNGAGYGRLIPLTKEWLDKFGVVWTGWSNQGYISGYEVLFADDYWFFIIGGAVESDRNEHIKVEYVHQLQNLYFALTGEELELQ